MGSWCPWLILRGFQNGLNGRSPWNLRFLSAPPPLSKKYNKTGSPFQLGNLEPSYQICWCHFPPRKIPSHPPPPLHRFEGESAPLSQPLIQARPLGPVGAFFPKDHNDHQRRPQFFGRWTLELKIFQKSCGCFRRFQVMTWKISMNLTLKLVSFGELSRISMERPRRSLFRVDVPKDSPGNMVRWFLAKVKRSSS